MNNLFISPEEINYCVNKYSKNLKIINTAKKAYDTIDSAKELNNEENFAAAIITLIMLNNNNKNMFDF